MTSMASSRTVTPTTVPMLGLARVVIARRVRSDASLVERGLERLRVRPARVGRAGDDVDRGALRIDGLAREDGPGVARDAARAAAGRELRCGHRGDLAVGDGHLDGNGAVAGLDAGAVDDLGAARRTGRGARARAGAGACVRARSGRRGGAGGSSGPRARGPRRAG